MDFTNPDDAPENRGVLIIANHGLLRMALNRLARLMSWEAVNSDFRRLPATRTFQGVSVSMIFAGFASADIDLKLHKSLVSHRTEIPLIAFAESEDVVSALEAAGRKISAVIRPNTAEDEIRSIATLVDRGYRVHHRSAVAAGQEKLEGNDTFEEIGKILTKRELLILEQISLGHSNKEIGERLRISTNTVQVHVSSIIRKLHVRNRMQAALLMASDR